MPDNGFRTRATTLFQSKSPFRSRSRSQGTSDPAKLPSRATFPLSQQSINEKSLLDDGSEGHTLAGSHSSNDRILTSSSGDVRAHNQAAQRLVRTIPTWVHSVEEGDEEADSTSQLLPKTPLDARVAQHNHSPAFNPHPKTEATRGRLHDSERDSVPPILAGRTISGSRWRAFADASAYPVLSDDRGEHVTEEWLLQNGADYSLPWLAGTDEEDVEKTGGRLFGNKAKRRAWWKRVQHVVLKNPIVPLVIRMTLWSFSLIALALGASIFRAYRDGAPSHQSGTSPEMAIIVDAVALVYILYITYDEYTGKPLGLRSAKSKMRLIFLDLFFIVFDSANLSLAFEALSDNPGSCQSGTQHNLSICNQQRALASVLMVALIAWLMTFSISVLRLVERVVQK